MNKRVTKHGKYRMKERLNIDKCSRDFFISVRANGYGMYRYKGKFFQFLMNKYLINNCLIKVYREKIYIFTNGQKRLITTYPVPKKYLPLSDYEIDERDFTIISSLKKLDGCRVKIYLKSGVSCKVFVISRNFVPYTNIKLRLKNNKVISIKAADIQSFKECKVIGELKKCNFS